MNSEAELAELRARLVDWRPDLTGTLMFVVAGDHVLLIRKLRGHGAGKINGPGGKLDGDETPLAGALRETREEVGIIAQAPRLAAVMRFLDLEGDDWLGYVFVARGYTGTATITSRRRTIIRTRRFWGACRGSWKKPRCRCACLALLRLMAAQRRRPSAGS